MTLEVLNALIASGGGTNEGSELIDIVKLI